MLPAMPTGVACHLYSVKAGLPGAINKLSGREPLLTRYTGVSQNFGQKVRAYILAMMGIR